MNKNIALWALSGVLILGTHAVWAENPKLTTAPKAVVADAKASEETKEKPKTESAPDTVVPPAEDPLAAPKGKIEPYDADEDAAQNMDVETETLSSGDFNKVESLGLPDSENDNLTKQVYSRSKRSVIRKLIMELSTAKWRTTQNLINSLMLTPANTEALENDVQPAYQGGEDLLTLRIAKLLERGQNAEAYALFTRLEVDPYNEKLARSGIMSMLLNGQLPLACVEMKTTVTPFKNGTFWKEMDAYCAIALNDGMSASKVSVIEASKDETFKKMAKDKSFRFPYSPKAFEALSALDKALLVSEGRIEIGNLMEGAAYKHIPAAHIQPLLTLKTLDTQTKILLTAQGVAKGVLSADNLTKRYIQIGRKAEKEKKHLEGFEHIATLYWKRADTFLPETRQATLDEIFAAAKAHGAELLAPFVSEISKFSPADSFTLTEIEAVEKAYLYTSKDMPLAWLDVIQKIPAQNVQEEKLKEKLLIAAALMSTDQENTQQKVAAIYDLLKKPANPALKNWKNIIENIDNRTGNYAKVRFAYEKGFDSGKNKGYIKPPAALLEQLALASQNQAMGETVLLCNLILREIDQSSVYPGTLADVARALSEVGLAKQSQKLVAEAVLGLQE